MRRRLLGLLLVGMILPASAQAGGEGWKFPALADFPETRQILNLQRIEAVQRDLTPLGPELRPGLQAGRPFSPDGAWIADQLSRLPASQRAAYEALAARTGSTAWTLGGPGGFELVVLVDRAGLPQSIKITLKGTRKKTDFTWDGQGRPLAVEDLSEDGEGRPLQIQRRLPDGTLATQHSFVWQDGLLRAEYLTERTATGTLAETVHRYTEKSQLLASEYREGGQLRWRDEYSHGSGWLESKTRTSFAEGRETSKDVQRFDREGRLVSAQNIVAGTVRAERRYEYEGLSDKLLLESAVSYAADGRRTSSEEIRYLREGGDIVSRTLVRDGVVQSIIEYGPDDESRERIFLRGQEILRVYYKGGARIRQEDVRPAAR